MPETITSPKDAMASFQSGLVSVLSNPEPEKSTASQPEMPPIGDKKPDATPAPTTPSAASTAQPVVEDKIPRTSQEWKKFTSKRDADIKERDERISKAEAKAAELESKLKAGVSSPELATLKAEADKLRKERDEYDERLKVVAVTQHPRFKQEFESKLSAQIDLAKRIVPEEHREAIERILSMPDGAFKDRRIEELTGELSQVQVSRLGAILNSVTEINAQREDIIKNAREEYDKMTKAQQAQVQQRQDAMESALKESLSKATEHPFYKKGDDAEWNKDVDTRIQQAEKLARSSLSVAQSTNIVLDHLALPVVQKRLEASQAEIEKLKAQIADFAGANPTIASRNREAAVDDGGGTPVRINQGSNPMAAASAWMKSLPKFG